MLNRFQGFSILELLLVLSITSVILALAIPYLPGVVKTLEFKKACVEIASSLRTTRIQAINTNRNTQWFLNLDKREFQGGKQKPTSLPKDIDIVLTVASKEKLSTTSAAISFYPDGSSTGGEIQLSQKKRKANIQVEWFTGRVRVNE